MSAQSSLNVALSPELASFIESRVASGRFQTASEVVSEALRLLEQQEQARDDDFRLLKEKLERGAAQALRGEVVDGEAFMAERRQQLLNRIAAQRP